MFKTGDTPISGYELVRFIGAGAYGEVWEALAPGGTRVALKFISLQSAGGSVELKSANAVKLIRHANLIPTTAIWVLDREGRALDDHALETIKEDFSSNKTVTVDELEFKRSLAYLVIAMALADDSLENKLEYYRQQGASGIPLDELLEYMRQAAKGLDFLNEPRHLVNGERVGIVHRDIKPANLLLIGDSVVIGDFGVATSLRQFDEKATEMVGSLGFMAPESLERLPTPTTDQYALAITYYYLRTGQMPYDAGQTFESLAQVHREGRLDFSLVDEREQAVLRKATALPPVPRYDNCAEFVKAVTAATQEAVVEEPAEKSPLPLVILGVAAVLLIALGWYWTSTWNDKDNGIAPDPIAKKQSHTILFSPESTKFKLEIKNSDDPNQPTLVDGQGKAVIELSENDKIYVKAQTDSVFYTSIDETYDLKQLKRMGWKIDLASRTVAEIRQEAFKLIESDQWDEATELLAKASTEKGDSGVLDFSSPQIVNQNYDVSSLTAGSQDSSYAVVAMNDASPARTVFRFPKMDSIEDDPATADWIESEILGVQKIFHLAESDQWLIPSTNAIWALDANREFELRWQLNDNTRLITSTATVSQNHRVLAVGDESGKVHIWQIAMDGSLENHRFVDAHTEFVNSLVFNSDATSLLSVGQDCTLKRLKISPDGDQPQTIKIEAPDTFREQYVIEAALADNNRVIVATDHQVYIVDFSDGSTLKPFGPSIREGQTFSIVQSTSNSPWVFVGTDSNAKPVQLFNIKTDQSYVPDFVADLGEITAASFSADGKAVAVSSRKGDLLFVDLTGNTPVWFPLPKSTSSYREHINLIADNKYLITILETGTEEIWPVDECRLIVKALEHARKIGSQRE